MNTQPILAYDCATTGASVALMQQGRITTRVIGNTQQAAELIPAIDALLREAGVGYAELSAIITTIGPGSFTGVRIGLAALHGLVQVHHTPIKLLTTLEAMAWQVAAMADAAPEYLVILRAGKGEVYTQAFRRTGERPTPTSEITLAPEGRTDWPLPCYGHVNDTQSPHYFAAPDAARVCDIAQHLPTATLTDAMPLYIRPPDAIIPTPYAWVAN